MTELAKVFDSILKHPGHITLALFLWALISVAILTSPISAWPEAWPTQGAIRVIFVLLAWLTGLLLSTKVINWIWNPLSRFAAEATHVSGVRRELARLSNEGRAALKIVADNGFSWFHGEPHEKYVMELRNASFARVDIAGEGWGRYNLTDKARAVVGIDFHYYHRLLELPAEDIEKVQQSMRYAEKVGKSLARPRVPQSR